MRLNRTPISLITLALGLAVFFIACGTGVTPPGERQDIGEEINATGQALYDEHCASCHGADATGGIGPNIRDLGAESIRAAIDTISLMGPLYTLTDEDLLNLAEYLGQVGRVVPVDDGGGGGGELDGQALYEANCSSCHGLDASGGIGPAIRNATSARIDAALANVPDMQTLPPMSADEISAIAEYLALVQPGDGGGGELDGQALYEANCSVCHGEDASGGTGPGPGPDILEATEEDITEAIGRVPRMFGLSALDEAQIAAIASFIASLGGAL